MKRTLEQTNAYVADLKERARPPQLAARYNWPPKWVQEWEPITEEELWRYLALLIYLAQHHTSNEREMCEH